MNARMKTLQDAVSRKQAVKVIAGIDNFDLANVLTLVQAATMGRATAVDIAARPDIVAEVRRQTSLAVFASCINPETLLAAAEAGVDVVELGNYDALYAEGLFFTYDEILKLARETVARVAGKALVSVTIPGHLSMATQIHMAKALESLGVDFIQTEGAARVLSIEPQIQPLTPEEKAAVTLRNTEMLAQHTVVPLITASGIHEGNVREAFLTGAAAVGIGSAVKRLETLDAMTEAICRIMREASRPVLVSSRQTAAMSAL